MGALGLARTPRPRVASELSTRARSGVLFASTTTALNAGGRFADGTLSVSPGTDLYTGAGAAVATVTSGRASALPVNAHVTAQDARARVIRRERRVRSNMVRLLLVTPAPPGWERVLVMESNLWVTCGAENAVHHARNVYLCTPASTRCQLA